MSKVDATNLVSCEWPSQPYQATLVQHPLLHSRLTELQVHTLLGVDFTDHKIWTVEEIYTRLRDVAA
jgi:hypothetical protein